jgi:hypothetical protein
VKKWGATAMGFAAGVLVTGGVVGGVWWSGRGHERQSQPSAMCTATSPRAQAVAVARLCAALRDGGLPELLGVPGEHTRQIMSFGGPGDDEDSDAVVHEVVRVGPYTVSLSQSRGFRLSGMLNGAQLTVAGHQADWYSASANGESFWTVEAAWDSADSGAGIYSVEVANDHAPLSKEETLRLSTTVAEKVMPRLPGWRSQ